RGNDDIPNAAIFAGGTAQNMDNQQFARAGVIRNLKTRLVLDHDLLLHLQVGHTGVFRADLALDDLFHNPALVARDRLRFHDLDLVANLSTDFVMGLDALAGMHHLVIQGMTELARDLHHDSLGHFVAGDDTNDSTTIVHPSPSTTSAFGCSRRMV